MSSEKTGNLGLHKWAPTDGVLRTEFNDNFGKIDEKVAEIGDVDLIPQNTIVDALKDKDDKIATVNLQVADTATPELFNTTGDGIADDTTKLENMFNGSGNKIKFGRNKTYKVTRKLKITKSFTEIDLNGSTILLDTSTVATQIFDNKLFYVAPATVDVNAKRANVTSVGVYYKFGNSPEKIAGKFTVNDVSKFAVGDCVVIEYQTAATNTHTLTDLKPSLATYAKILEIDVTNKIVYTDYYTELDFKGLPPVSGSGFMYVIDPVKKVTIKNGTLKSITPNATGKKDCAIRAEYTDGLTLENITLIDFNDKAIQPRYTRNFRYSNIESDVQRGDKTIDYVIQTLNAYNGIVENITGATNTAILDFSFGASYIHARNIQSRNNNGSWGSIQLHGEGEHDIMFENCSGYFSFANNTGEFPGHSYNITLENCKGASYLMGCENLQINNSNLIVTSTDYSNLRIYGVSINDSKIQMTKSVLYKASTRGGVISPYIRFSNTEVIPFYDGTTGLYKFNFIGFDEVSFSNNSRLKNKNSAVGAYIVLDAVKDFDFKNGKNEGFLFSIRVNDGGTATPFTFGKYVFDGVYGVISDDNNAVKLSTTSLDAMISFANISDLTGQIIFKDSNLFFKRTHARPWKLFDLGNVTPTSNLTIIADDNRIEAGASGEVTSYLPHNAGYQIKASGNKIDPDIINESGDYRLSKYYTTPPTNGKFNYREMLLNKTMAAGGKAYWVNVATGVTAGTWKAFGGIDV
ncbi:hypothetical protein P4597_18930 [Peribacillus simplex]|uniref:hypothetical protein n=1 Tax=Peribacillus simplex TaxID=1478 RepID=UPI002E1A58AA|nr:hypothetical protein [Peribacillus simplex]